RIRHPPGAGADARGPADGGAGQAQLAPKGRPADRREPGAQEPGQAGLLARRRQYHALEGVRRRHRAAIIDTLREGVAEQIEADQAGPLADMLDRMEAADADNPADERG